MRSGRTVLTQLYRIQSQQWLASRQGAVQGGFQGFSGGNKYLETRSKWIMRSGRTVLTQLYRIQSQQWLASRQGAVQGGLEKYYEMLYYQQLMNFAKTAKKTKKQHEGVTSKRADHAHAGDNILDITDHRELMQRAIAHFDGSLTFVFLKELDLFLVQWHAS
eukprot:TRINITY_DN55295_c0_g1_i1.p2 TRINITY_DN55295_c0_g1~~TRINITY_DN55295_c0_g1_i1.p2  ORF type:complete len:187 (-),score=14.95 TRINITY_DN55295_c0_g1_i1:18-503(-)